MGEILRLKKSNCKNCYKCIRHCPVKSIKFSAGQAHVVENECILCGRCFAACPQNAKQISSDMEKVRVMLMTDTVYASIAPSFAANYPGVGIDALEAALKQLGFAGAEETAVGATIVKKEYERILDEEKPNVMISSCCPSINLLIRKHCPDTLFALAPVVTPMEAHCADIKRRHPEAKVVFIGPCIAKKSEAEEAELADAVLLFEELDEWLAEKNISLAHSEDTREGGKARLFPITGGILNTMRKNSEYTYFSVDGVEKCLAVLEEIKSGTIHRCFIEMSACEGSCVGGPVMVKHHHDTFAHNYSQVVHYAPENDFDVQQPQNEKCHKNITPISLFAHMPSEEEIAATLLKMGKKTPEDQLNCGSCGYNTCREKAIAVIHGKAELSMCLPFMMQKAESFSDAVVVNSPNAIIVLNDDLEVQRINPVAARMLHIRNDKDVLGENISRIMEPELFENVRDKKRTISDERTYLAEYGCYVDRTIIYNAEAHLFICLMHDVSEEMDRVEKKLEVRNQAVSIADDMAKKQLKIVQDIASLLGETAADTLIALEHLKETISDD